MKIENYRTQSFRDKVNHIVVSRKHEGEVQKIQYNFDRNCNTKSIILNGKPIENCVAYYRVNITKKKSIKIIQQIYYIEANDLKILDRNLKLHHLKGEDVIIKSSRKIPLPEETKLVENEIYILSEYPKSYPIKIIRRAKTTAKYVKCDYTFNEKIMNKLKGKGLKYSSIENLNFDIHCKLEDLVIFDKTDPEIETLRLYDGVWRPSNYYWSASIINDGKTYSKSRYFPA